MKKNGIETLRKDALLLAKMIAQKDNISTWDFAKQNTEYNNPYELKRNEVYVRQFLERWAMHGIITCEKNDGKSLYGIDFTKIDVRQNECRIGRRKIRGLMMSLCIENKWVILQL